MSEGPETALADIKAACAKYFALQTQAGFVADINTIADSAITLIRQTLADEITKEDWKALRFTRPHCWFSSVQDGRDEDGVSEDEISSCAIRELGMLRTERLPPKDWNEFRACIGVKCRTISEEYKARFRASTKGSVPSTCRARHVINILRQALRLQVDTKTIRLKLVYNKRLKRTCIYDTATSTLNFNTRKLDEDSLGIRSAMKPCTCAQQPSCPKNGTSYWDAHICEDVVVRMLSTIFQEIYGKRLERSELTALALSTSLRMIRCMPLDVQLRPEARAGELKVLWKDWVVADAATSENSTDARQAICVMLETYQDGQRQHVASRHVEHGQDAAVFTSLDPAIRYIAQVQRIWPVESMCAESEPRKPNATIVLRSKSVEEPIQCTVGKEMTHTAFYGSIFARADFPAAWTFNEIESTEGSASGYAAFFASTLTTAPPAALSSSSVAALMPVPTANTSAASRIEFQKSTALPPEHSETSTSRIRRVLSSQNPEAATTAPGAASNVKVATVSRPGRLRASSASTVQTSDVSSSGTSVSSSPTTSKDDLDDQLPETGSSMEVDSDDNPGASNDSTASSNTRGRAMRPSCRRRQVIEEDSDSERDRSPKRARRDAESAPSSQRTDAMPRRSGRINYVPGTLDEEVTYYDYYGRRAGYRTSR